MINQMFTLKNNDSTDNKTTVKVKITIRHNQLMLDYQILGDLSHYHFPQKTKQERADELWKETTFELFIAPLNSDEYWEINISPSTQWNMYHFTSYKEGMKASNIISLPSIKTYEYQNEYRLSFKSIIPKEYFDRVFSINLCVILLDQKGERHFYSIERRKRLPDFHDRDTFFLL